MHKFSFKINKINRYLFPFFIGIASVALGLETYSYLGFLKKHIFVDSRFFLVLALMSTFLVIQNNEKKDDFFMRIKNVIIKINNLLLPILTVTYLVMQALEASHYHNYIFSKIHVQQDNFLYLVILSFGIFLINKFAKKTIKTNNPSILLIFIMLAFIVIDNLKISINEAVYSDFYIASHINMTYDKKMGYYWGFFYDYMLFVKENTPENSTIIVPPQESPWFMTGNIGLVRYFLYPRNFIQGTYDKPLDINSADYVMLAWGEWKENDVKRYGWPKVKVDAEETILLNGDKNWGILKIKR